MGVGRPRAGSPRPANDLPLGMATAAIGIGTNLGDREATIRDAVEALRAHPGITSVRVSAVIETDPVGIVDQPKFLNAAACVETTLSASDLLVVLLRLEQEAGRIRAERNGPRTLDLDLLLLDDVVPSADLARLRWLLAAVGGAPWP